MEKKIFVFFILAFVIVLSTIFIFIMFDGERNNLDNLKTSEVCFKNNCFIVELAKTQEQITRGLMFRESMDANKGMLFVFGREEQHSFWMKNTLIALDIIWIDANKRVVHIEKDMRPCIAGQECEKIKSNESAKYVLELNAGIADKIGLKINHELYFNID